MKFSLVNTALLSILAATSIASPVPEVGDVNADIPEATTVVLTGEKVEDGSIVLSPEPTSTTDLVARDLEKRAGPVVYVIGIAAIKGVAIITKIAIEIGAETVKNLGEWNKARETFTRKTVDEMWARNPDYKRYPAVMCYNKAYHFQNGKWTGRVKAKFELYTLSTDYDCMYMEGGNQFYTHAEGGWVNLAYRYNNRCTHDGRTGDLTCR